MIGYLGVFLAGVILDEIFGARLISKFEALLKDSETRILGKIQTLLGGK